MTGHRTSVAPWAPLLTDPSARAALGEALVPLLAPDVTRRFPADLDFDPCRDEIDAWIDRADAQADIYTITRRDTGALAGLLFLFSDGDDADGDLMIGYFLGPAHWGEGLASDMMAGLVAHFDAGPPRRLFAGTDADNVASQRVLEKAGFVRETADSVPERAAFIRRCGR